MYFSLQSLVGFRAAAIDSDLGKVIDFCVAPDTWEVRTILVRTNPLFGTTRSVDTRAVKLIEGGTQRIELNLTFADFQTGAGDIAREWTPNDCTGSLIRISDLIGCTAFARNKEVGSLSDLVADTNRWRVHEIVLRDGWLFRTTHRLTAQWIAGFDRDSRRLDLDLDAEELIAMPEFDPQAAVNTTREVRTVDYTARSKLQGREEIPP